MKKTYAKSEIIFRQGDAADSMYEVVAGSIGIYANYGESNEKLLTTLEKGATFGEMGMIDKLPRSATAVSMEDGSQVMTISLDNFAEYFREHPGKVLSIMQLMSGRIRNLTEGYLEACRAVTEYEENGAGSKKSGWLKTHFKKFLDDYADAYAYGYQHPDMYIGLHRENGPFIF